MTRTPAAFVRQAFDQYATHYDRHARNMEYAVPAIIASAIAHHPVLSAGNHLGPVLDLGCGTGLAANALQEHRLAPITGIDIAPAMLAEARAKHLYADLVEADIIDFLATSETQWPVIIAADALCYFGGLTDLLSNIRQGLTPDGWFIFSIETLLPDHDGSVPGNGSWALQPEGRYAHSSDYISDCICAAGLRLLREDRCTLRQAFGAGVPGVVLTVGPAAP
jgi:predicted TPR repeat methyltransferase